MTAGRRATEYRACVVWGEMTDRGFGKFLAIHGATALSDGFDTGPVRELLSAGDASMIEGRSLAGKPIYGARGSRTGSAAVGYSGAILRILGLRAFEPVEWTKLLRLISDCLVVAPIEWNGRNKLPC